MDLNFHLYHHDDLDGVASGAIFFDFLKKQGGDILTCTPLEYSSAFDDKSLAWKNYKFQSPSFLVDFRYHPNADWWIDHHESSFSSQEWKDAYSDDEHHIWRPKAPSACGLVLSFLKEKHGYEPSKIVEELAKVVDEDDSAGYSTLDDALEIESASKKIQLLLGDTEMKKDREKYLEFRDFLVRNLAISGMDAIVLLPQYKDLLEFLIKQRLDADEAVRSKVELKGNVVYIEKDPSMTHSARWVPYQVYPEAPYSVQVQDKGGEFKVSIGSNKWSKEKPSINLGELARKYNGGGHFGVGALFTKDREEAMRISKEIIDSLNK